MNYPIVDWWHWQQTGHQGQSEKHPPMVPGPQLGEGRGAASTVGRANRHHLLFATRRNAEVVICCFSKTQAKAPCQVGDTG